MKSFDYKHYVPVLKGKMGEFRALNELDATTSTAMTPLFEVPPIPWDYDEEKPSKKPDEHVSKFVPSVEKNWGKRPAFVDTLFISREDKMESGKLPISAIFDDARKAKLRLIPVTGLTRDNEYQEAVKDIMAADGHGVCVRIETTDIEDENLGDSLVALEKLLNAKKPETDLVIDLKAIQKDQMGLLVRSVRDVIRSLPEPEAWRTLTLIATAFPQTMSLFEPNSVSLTSRVEWQLWTTLLHSPSRLPRIPTFGDYTVVHPELLEIDPRIMQLGAKIKYTFENEWIIVKGISINRGGAGQTKDLCKTLIDLAEYRGPDYSYGDKYISECANGIKGVGNQTTWVTVAVNHHITFVVKQLRAYFASSMSPVV